MTTTAARPGTGTDHPSEDLARDLRFSAAANYLTAAQIYLLDNPLLRAAASTTGNLTRTPPDDTRLRHRRSPPEGPESQQRGGRHQTGDQ
jgi:phosphoketolase